MILFLWCAKPTKVSGCRLGSSPIFAYWWDSGNRPSMSILQLSMTTHAFLFVSFINSQGTTATTATAFVCFPRSYISLGYVTRSAVVHAERLPNMVILLAPPFDSSESSQWTVCTYSGDRLPISQLTPFQALRSPVLVSPHGNALKGAHHAL